MILDAVTSGTVEFPSLERLGRDLLVVAWWRRALSLAAPFALALGYFACAYDHRWTAAIACTMLLTFLTYGSVSHDLVHRTLRLSPRVNEVLLCAIELLSLRSGHAYRVAHLNHHAHFPDADDLEGAAAAMTWWRALLDGMTLQPRLWWLAMRRQRRDRAWIAAEGAGVVILFGASMAAIPWTVAPAGYAALMIAGSWVFPFVTSFIPHDSQGRTTLTRTRLFRGRILSIVALEHLYHLEHHLYPQVPHHNWARLAQRLDPYFERAGVRPVRLLF